MNTQFFVSLKYCVALLLIDMHKNTKYLFHQKKMLQLMNHKQLLQLFQFLNLHVLKQNIFSLKATEESQKILT